MVVVELERIMFKRMREEQEDERGGGKVSSMLSSAFNQHIEE